MTSGKLTAMDSEALKKLFRRFCVVVVFGVAFAYIESAVVIYLRAIFYPDGFTFPLSLFSAGPHWQRLLLTEIGREAASLVLIFSGAWLFGCNLRQRFAYFMTIFAVWDIFYYVWLKVLLNWPVSIMDWDVLFLIPLVWAAPVLAPVLVSLALFSFAAIILRRDCIARPIRAGWVDWLGFFVAGIVVVVSFCVAGIHIAEADYRAYFSWPVFALGYILAVGLFIKCFSKSK